MENQKKKGENLEERRDYQWRQDTCREIHGCIKRSGCL